MPRSNVPNGALSSRRLRRAVTISLFRKIVLFLFALSVFAAASVASAAPILNPGTGNYYEFVEEYISWTGAKWAACSRQYLGMGGYLATVTSQAENDWILANILPSGTYVTGVWIGGSQDSSGAEPGGGWQWDVCTGEPFSYTNWEGPPESSPDNAGGCEEFIEMHLGTGKWGDAGNGPVPGGLTQTRGFVVEYGGPVSSPCPTNAYVSCTPSALPAPACGPLPTTPSPCSASDASSASVTCTWANVANEDGYRIFRNAVQVGSVGVDVTSFVDVPSPGTYTYCVEAFNAGGSSPQCCDSGTRLVPPLPLTPSPCSATDASSANVTFTWANVANEDGYRVFRNAVQVGSVGVDVTSFVDVPSPGTYTYCVEAFNAGGSSPQCCDSGTRTQATSAPGIGPFQLAALLALLGAAGSQAMRRRKRPRAY